MRAHGHARVGGGFPTKGRFLHAFTFAELLTVTAGLGMLAGLGFSGRGDSKAKSQSLACADNARQLAMAWTLYAADNHGKCVDNFGLTQTDTEITAGTFRNWANNAMSWGGSTSVNDRSNTNVAWARSGLLTKYIGGSIRVYKCPADDYLSAAQVQAGFKARLRSVSMNAYCGPFSASSVDQSAIANTFETDYRQFMKISQVGNPSGIFVTLDENPNSINDGYFLNTLGNSEAFGDSPASYHNGAGTLSFADEHVETHQWLGKWIYAPTISVIPNTSYNGGLEFVDGLGRQDFQWLWARTGVPLR
jgi:hypothetical protein